MVLALCLWSAVRRQVGVSSCESVAFRLSILIGVMERTVQYDLSNTHSNVIILLGFR